MLICGKSSVTVYALLSHERYKGGMVVVDNRAAEMKQCARE